jgi:hypothetical protein
MGSDLTAAGALDSIKEQVFFILNEYPESALRHDLILAALVYQRFYGVSPESSFNQIIHKVMKRQIPNPETIQRIRQMIMKKCDSKKTTTQKTITKKAADVMAKAFTTKKGSSNANVKSKVNSPRTASRNSSKK